MNLIFSTANAVGLIDELKESWVNQFLSEKANLSEMNEIQVQSTNHLGEMITRYSITGVLETSKVLDLDHYVERSFATLRILGANLCTDFPLGIPEAIKVGYAVFQKENGDYFLILVTQDKDQPSNLIVSYMPVHRPLNELVQSLEVMSAQISSRFGLDLSVDEILREIKKSDDAILAKAMASTLQCGGNQT